MKSKKNNEYNIVLSENDIDTLSRLTEIGKKDVLKEYLFHKSIQDPKERNEKYEEIVITKFYRLDILDDKLQASKGV